MAERFSLIPEAEFVVPRFRKLIANRLIRCSIIKHASDTSGVRSRFPVFLSAAGWRESATLSHRPLDSFSALSLHREMSELPSITPKKNVERAAREARLAKALRENLVRRKQQKRAQEGREVRQSQKMDRKREPPA